VNQIESFRGEPILSSTSMLNSVNSSHSCSVHFVSEGAPIMLYLVRIAQAQKTGSRLQLRTAVETLAMELAQSWWKHLLSLGSLEFKRDCRYH